MKIMTIIKNEKGQSLVEFALVIPVVLLIIMGIIEFGLMFNAYLTITNASREGARLGAVGGSDTEIETLVTNITPNLDSDQLKVSITPIEGDRNRGDSITVSINYNYQVMIPLINDLINDLLEFDAKTVMRVE